MHAVMEEVGLPGQSSTEIERQSCLFIIVSLPNEKFHGVGPVM